MDPNQLYQGIAQQGGGQQPAQPQQPVQGGGIADEIGKFLMHPAVQALAGAYFGAISSPRRSGLGGAIGRGGLAGLETFGAAEQQQNKAQALQAEAAQRAATFGLDQSKANTEAKKAELAQAEFDRTKATNQPIGPQSAARILAMHKEMAADFDVPTLGAMPSDKVATLIATYRKEGANAPMVASVIAKNNAEAEAARERGGIENAGLGLKGQELGLQSKELGLKEREIADKESSSTAETAKGKVWATEYKAAQADYIKTHPQHMGGLYGGGTPQEADAYATDRANAAVAGFHAPGGVTPVAEHGTASAAESPTLSKPTRGTHNGKPGTFDPATSTFTPD